MLGHGPQRKGGAGGLDVVQDVRRLLDLLVGRHHEPLQERGVDLPPEEHHQVEGGRDEQVPHAAPHGLDDRHHRGDHRGRDQHAQGRHARVDVDVGRAEQDARLARQQGRDPQPRPHREHAEQGRHQQGEVAPHLQAHHEPAVAEPQRARHRVGERGSDERHHDRGHEEALNELEERQRENVEPGVPPEDRVPHTERARVAEEQPALPLRGRGHGQDHRDQDREAVADPPEPAAADGDAARPLLGHDRERARGRHLHRRPQVEQQPRERENQRRGPQRALRRQRAQEDGLVSGLTEPEPVRVDVDEGRRGEHEHGHEDDRDPRQAPHAASYTRPSPRRCFSSHAHASACISPLNSWGVS